MSLILNIETALEVASVCLASDGKALRMSTNDNPKEHSSWLHGSIVELMQHTGYSLSALDAVAVSIGPGSYTGLRVGLASAKGFCYALKKPLITVGTLEMMAFAVRDEATDLIGPMIDARRMEVFTAIYDKSLREKISPGTMILEADSFKTILSTNELLFCGSGIKKLKELISGGNARFSDRVGDASHLAALAQARFNKKNFADLAYSEPLYIKEFYSPAQKSLK